MSSVYTNDINSALVSGISGLYKAQNQLTSASYGLANLNSTRSTDDVLADAARQQLSLPGQILNSIPTNESATDNLVKLSIGLENAAAAAKVIGSSDGVIGRVIDELV